MPQDYLALYLRLTPEFGGTRFGPFEEVETRLGSAEDNNIQLPETLGVAPHHIKILQQSGMGLILTPVERTASVFLWSEGARRPKQIATPVAVRSGDSFSLVTPEGPRFVVEIDRLPEQEIQKREQARLPWGKRGLPTADALKDEAKRQGLVYLLTTGPGQLAGRSWQFIRSGTFLQPRYLFAFAAVGVGYVGSAVLWIQNGGIQAKLETAEKAAAQYQSIASSKDGQEEGIVDYSLQRLAESITGIPNLGAALEEDKALLEEFKDRCKNVMVSPQYEWLVKPQKGGSAVDTFVEMRKAMKDFKPPEVGQILIYAAATPKRTEEAWIPVYDSSGLEVCGRGSLALTYRQAQNLDLEPPLDALITGDPTPYEKASEGHKEKRLEKFKETDSHAIYSEADSLETFESDIDPLGQGRGYCLSVEGDDNRTSTYKVAAALKSYLGEKAPMLPEYADSPYFGLTSRIAKLYLSDVTGVDFSQRTQALDFSNAAVGVVLSDYGPPGQWVIERTAEVLARSVVLPCRALLTAKSPEERESLKSVFGEMMPDPLYCLVLNYKIQNE